MRTFTKPSAWLAAIALLLTAASTDAALPIDLEVAAEQNAPFGAMQEWGQMLSEMNLAHVRLRGAKGNDKPDIQPVGEGAGKHYNVTAILTRRDELLLPGGKFTQGDRARLKQFFQDLPDRFEESKIQRGPFGLQVDAYNALLEDLSTTVDQTTKDRSAESVVSAVAATIKTSLTFSDAATGVLHEAPALTAELKGMSAGTGLAVALRAANLVMIPQQEKGSPLVLRIESLAADQSAWPVGWKPRGAPKQVAPAMYESTMVEIEGYPLEKALTALAPHMGVALVYDQRTLAVRHIDPAKAPVKFPAGKTYIRRAVDRVLGQAQLAGELRIDDAGRPFYWMTQYGPESPHAKELVRVAVSK